ncbi:uncharacterized protein LOC122974233 isoform X2 [Thunnus albacares]|uniref:uncharacterized protein LOC122974233 isoform X2 n=1 Tax=Thunnus albacares TaxID=8236 RepID=UPI001CF6103D|nr:uncharacterized protein LOC122974233 isoform X2 [Thunnus albacares]
MAVMDVKLSAALCWTLLLLFVDLVSSEDIKVKLGEDAILPCGAPNSDPVSVVEWTRGDLKSEYVFLYRDGHSDTDYQNPSFKDRVELVDSEMKNGDLSVRLKNVAINDSGTYECHVIQSRANRRKRSSYDTEPINTIRLDVEGKTGYFGGAAGDTAFNAGPTAGNTEGGKDMRERYIVTLPVAALILISAAGFVIKKSKGHFPVQSVDDPDVHQQLQENENSQSKTISHNISDMQV